MRARTHSQASSAASSPPTSPFPVVGIGTSAGGLEALELFFTHVPASAPLAIVIVQHLDPAHKSMLPELLQRVSNLPVHEARNGMRVDPGCVYVLPASKDMSILHGVLFLFEPVESRGLRLPIDFFLRALAEDQHEYAIGVILSGMGSDGTLGVKAIKEHGGLVLAQAPASAKFASMPRSAIDTGLVDIVAAAEELPARIQDYLAHLPSTRPLRPGPGNELVEGTPHSSLEKIIVLLRERTGNDFSLYKKNTLYRRIERRMGLHQIDTPAAYVDYLRHNGQELDLLFRELLIGVTSFFRDPAVWNYLRDQAWPELLAAFPEGRHFRAWVPACSTGEEAYTLAIVFREAVATLQPAATYSLKIFATDLDPDAIRLARQGLYVANIVADVGAERLARHFTAEDGAYRIAKELREMVIFAPQNIIMDAPFTRLDLLSCRNLLIYFGPALQRMLVPLFHYALNPQGLLLLGSAETIGSFTGLFGPLDNKTRLYRRLDTVTPSVELNFTTPHFPAAFSVTDKAHPLHGPTSQQHQVEQLLLQRYTPAAVLINADGDLLHINGSTGKYLEPAAGKANWNIHVMAREGLRLPLTRAVQKAVREQSSLQVDALLAGSGAAVRITVQALTQPEALRGKVLVVFTDLPAAQDQPLAPDPASRGALAEELQQAQEALQALREENQLSHEELQSTNEELQSINEELTTSKEEMQSMNEELQTVNAELQSKVDTLSSVNNDMKNLLNSTEIATVFLDNDLRIRRFTPYATRLIKLIPHDVGRPLSDIVSDLDYPRLCEDAQDVLTTLMFSDKSVPTHDGRWFKVRIMPYRTHTNVIDGVVITFTDITEAKQLELQLRAVLAQTVGDHEPSSD